MPSLLSKNSKHGIQRLVSKSSTRNTEMLHRRPRTEDVLCKMGFLSTGKLTNTATSIAVDENQLIRWARTNRPKNKKIDRYVSFEVETARCKKRARCTICCSRQKSRSVVRRLSSVADLRAPGSQLKCQQQQLRSPFLRLIQALSSYPVVSRSRSTTQPATNGAAPKISDAKSKKSFRSALQNTVGRVSQSRDLFLFGLFDEVFIFLSGVFFSFSNVNVRSPCCPVCSFDLFRRCSIILRSRERRRGKV